MLLRVEKLLDLDQQRRHPVRIVGVDRPRHLGEPIEIASRRDCANLQRIVDAAHAMRRCATESAGSMDEPPIHGPRIADSSGRRRPLLRCSARVPIVQAIGLVDLRAALFPGCRARASSIRAPRRTRPLRVPHSIALGTRPRISTRPTPTLILGHDVGADQADPLDRLLVAQAAAGSRRETAGRRSP